MLRGVLRTVRYARSWRSGADVQVHETEILREGVRVPATLIRPARVKGPLPGWIAVVGVSRMGRFHPQLMRFANSLASSGSAVLVPEIPEWRDLNVRPGFAAPTIRGSIDLLRARSDIRPGKFGLIGFSFGAPQVAISAAREDLSAHVAGAVLFGGYCCLHRTLHFQFTGRHEWDGADYERSPDPYGRWVIASNHLTDVPGCEDARDVAAALRQLAVAASEGRVSAWDPHHDKMIEELRLALPAGRRALFDLFATPTYSDRPGHDECADIGKRLADACRRVEPLLDPGPNLSNVRIPTRLIHGRGDRLIPFSEGLRLMDRLPPTARAGTTVTGLFAHSAGHTLTGFSERVRESVTFFEALRGVINTV
jgi:pimeloyl-ACP methyl ester carboxylesterase